MASSRASAATAAPVSFCSLLGPEGYLIGKASHNQGSANLRLLISEASHFLGFSVLRLFVGEAKDGYLRPEQDTTHITASVAPSDQRVDPYLRHLGPTAAQS